MASASSCKNELRAIIAELKSIRDGVKSDFKYIGQDMCGKSFDKVIDKCERALRSLNKI